MKRPLPDGTLHRVLAPVEFLRRVAALVPPPGSNLVRFHGVFAPGSALRPQVVPKAETPAEPPAGAAVAKRKRAPRLEWAQRLKRTFDVDVFACGRCGGRLEGVGGAQGGGCARPPAAAGAAGRAAPGGALARAARRGVAAPSHGARPVATVRQEESRAEQGAAQGQRCAQPGASRGSGCTRSLRGWAVAARTREG